jgi:hypothetical protein
LNVPDSGITPTPALKPRTAAQKQPKYVHFRCACGKSMRAQKSYIGRLARCPACGDDVVISEAGEGAAQRFRVDTRTPVPRTKPAEKREEVPRARELDDYDDDSFFERPRKRRPRRKEQDGGKVMTWLGLGLLLFISVSALAAATIWLVITPDAKDVQTEAPDNSARGALYATQPTPQQTQAPPVTLHIPAPEVSFPTRPEISPFRRGTRQGR